MPKRTVQNFSNQDLAKLVNILPEIERFTASPEHDLFVVIRENRTALSMLTSNFGDLSKVLKFHNHGNIESELWDPTKDFRFKLQKRLIRMLMNYLSTVFFIVDYSRNRTEGILSQNNSIHLVFKEKLTKQFSNDPLHRFIQDLRNYCTHRTFPKIASNSSFNPGTKQLFNTTVCLRKAELLENFTWSPIAKNYIESHDDKILIADLIASHYQNFMQFQNWIFLQILMVNKSKTENLLNKMSMLFELLKEKGLAHALPFRQSFIRYLKFAFDKACGIENDE